MKEKQEYVDLVLGAVEDGKRAGADAAEAYISDSESVQVMVSNREVEQVNAANEAGIGLRVLKDGKMAFGSTNELSRESVRKLVDDLMRKLPFHSPDEFNGIAERGNTSLTDPWSSYSERITYDPEVSDTPVQEKVRRTLRMEAAGLDFDHRIGGAMMVVYQDRTAYTYIANSNGLSGWFPGAGCGGAVEFSAVSGADHQSGSYSKAAAAYADFDPEGIGRKGAENAVKMLGAGPIASCEIPMVVAPEVGTEIFSFLAGMLSADEVQKGRSLFAGKLQTKVAADAFHLVDDGRLKGGLGTSPVDAEGVPQQTTPLIVGGVLKNFLYDTYTARKGKIVSTGNRSRGGFSSQGGIGPTNLYLQPGRFQPAEILATIRRGFYLTQAIGIFAGINTASGDFSIPAAGFLIEQGKLTRPVRGITIGGNLFEMLKSVDKIGNDLTWFQTFASPTFSVSSIKIGGAAKS